MKCPCKNDKKYSTCCGRYHLDNLNPPTVEALVRARYSAYVLNKNQFIYNTWHTETRPALDALRLLKKNNYVDLKILNTDMGLEHHDIGTVTFNVSYQEGKITKEHKEIGLFKRENNKWVYYKSHAS